LVYCLVKAETVGHLLVARISQHQLVAADQHRYLTGGDVEAIQQLLYVWIPFEVYVGVGMAIAHQELFDPQCPGGMGGADEHHVSQAGRHKLHPAQDEGTQQDLAELGIGLHQRQQLCAIQLDRLTRLGDA
jgi:hypothetical protein